MRPRQIDVTKPLPVVWLKTDEVSHQAQALEGLYKSLTVSKRSSEQVKQKNAELVQSQTRVPLKVCMGEVPIPACRIVDEGKEPDPPFTRGQSYIHYAEAPYDFDATEYELDDEDLQFLDDWNLQCSQDASPGERLTDCELEVMLNTFDNEAFLLRGKKRMEKLEDKLRMVDLQGTSAVGEDGSKLVSVTEDAVEKLREFARAEGVDEALLEYLNMPAEEDVACAVCRQALRRTKSDGESEDSSSSAEAESENSCDAESCLPEPARTRQQDGRDYVVESRRGRVPSYRNPERILHCAECDTYVHVRCYMPAWLPETSKDDWLCDYCDDVLSDLTASKSKRCELCNFDDGLLKRVSGSSHKRAHVTCALLLPEASMTVSGVVGIEDVHPSRWGMVCKSCHEAGACVQCQARYCRAAYHPMCALEEDLLMNFSDGTVYCPKHSSEMRAKDEAGAGLAGVTASSKRKVDMQLLMITPLVKEHSMQRLGEYSVCAAEAAFGYWFRKRQVKGSAIVPRLALMQQEAMERESTSRRRGKKVRLDIEEWVDRVVQLRQDLERGRIILDMVRKREVMKRDWTAESREIFELYIAHEEQSWSQEELSQPGRGNVRHDSPPRSECKESFFAEGMHHLWQHEPEPLSAEEVQMLFPPGKRAMKKQTSTSFYGNGRVRVLERDADGRFKGSGTSKRSHKRKDKKRPKRPSTGRPVGRPRKHPLPQSDVEPPVKVDTQETASKAKPFASADPEGGEVDVTNVEESDCENSDVDIDGGIEDDAPLPVMNGSPLFAASPYGMNDTAAFTLGGSNGAHVGATKKSPTIMNGSLGKRKSSRLNGVPLPAEKKRR